MTVSILFTLIIMMIAALDTCSGNTELSAITAIEPSTRVIHCTALGFNSFLSLKVLKNILGISKDLTISSDMQIHEVDVNLEGQGKPSLALEFGKVDQRISRNDSDIAVVYVHYATIVNDPQTLVLQFNRALGSILAEGPKRSVLLVLAVPQKLALSEYQNSAINLLSEAWQLLPEKDSLNNTDLSGKFDIQVLTYSLPTGGITSDFNFEKRDILESLLKRQGRNDYRTIDSLKPTESFSSVRVDLNRKDHGLDICMSAAEAAADWARQAANANLQKLQKPESASSFKLFMENLLESAIKEMDNFLEKEHCSPSIEARLLANEDLTRDIHTMMHPFFKRFVQLGRQDAAKAFNAAVQSELEISIRILEDLKALKNRVLKQYSKDIEALTPKCAPEYWRINFEVSQFEKTLDEFIEQREGQSRLQGILPRGRRPIEVSFFHFLLHPFGRDHRQDPLGMLKTDKLSYKSSLAQHPDISISPSKARFLAKSSADKEFAREMLMLPLSVKNPAVPMASKRSRKRSGPPAKDYDRPNTGPERFIDWKKVPMNKIIKGDELQGTEEENVLDKVLNVLPYFGKGYYKHPSYNYGSKYSP